MFLNQFLCRPRYAHVYHKSKQRFASGRNLEKTSVLMHKILFYYFEKV